MAGKPKPAKKRDPNRIMAAGPPNEDKAVFLARTVLRPTVQAAVTLKEFGARRRDTVESCRFLDVIQAENRRIKT